MLDLKSTGGQNSAISHEILSLYRERKDHTTNFHDALFRRYARRYDMFRCVTRTKNTLGRHKVFLPYVFAMLESAVARKVQISFGQRPYMDFEGTDPSICRRNASIITNQLDDADVYRKMVDFYLTADMYGLGVLKTGWQTLRRKERWRAVNPDTGKEFVEEGMRTRFDGPNFTIKDPIDFWPQPGQRRVDDCLWAMDAYWRDLSQIEEDVALGRFYPGALAALKAMANPPKEITAAYEDRYNLYRSQFDQDARRGEKFAAPVRMVDMWGIVPDQFAISGCNMVLLTVANDAVVMRYREFPFYHGDLGKLFITYSPQPDPHYMHGMGKIEVVESLQFLANRFASQKADALDRYMDSPWLVSMQSGIDEDSLWLSPSKVLQVNGDVDDSKIRPLVPDLRPIMSAGQEIAELFQQMQIGTGQIDDAAMGIPRSSRTTKAEFQGRQENVLTRLLLECRLAEEGVVVPLGNTFRSLNQQYLRVPKEMALLGQEGGVDPVTGFPTEPEQRPITMDDLDLSYKARAVGATQILGKSLRQNELAMVNEMVIKNPVAMQTMNWVSWLRYTLKTFNFPHVEEFLVKNQPPAINALAEGSGQDPNATLQALLGGGMGQPSPDLVNLLGGSNGSS